MPSSAFNWETGTWTDEKAQIADAVVCIAGDWAPIRSFQPIIEKNPSSIYGDLLQSIRASDLSIVNLESPLSDIGTPASKSGAVFKGDQRHVKGLLAVPFDVVTLANNHMFDFGVDSFQQTMSLLEDNKIRHVGAGMTESDAAEPLVVDVNGVKIGIVNFSEGEDLTAADNGPGVMGWDLDCVIRTVQELKKTTDFVIVIGHCGIEYIPFPPPYVINAFEKIADSGADFVIGHHPHVPQGISFHNNIPICYSLGNFVFYQETDLKFRKIGYMVKLGIKGDKLVSVELVPYGINDQGLFALKDDSAKAFYKKFKEISLPLADPKQVEDSWNGFLDHYGTEGFLNELSMIMGKINDDPQKGAAMFRNRLTTLQHYNHLKDLMTRIVDKKMSTSPKWAQDITHEWLNAKIGDN